MNKAIVKEGAVFQNHMGQWGKIVEIKNGYYFYAGWFSRKDQAEEAETRVAFCNELGLKRIMGDSEMLTNPPAEGADPDAGGDDASGDEDPYKDFTNADLKEALKEAELAVSGNRSELIERLEEAGIELVAE